MGRELEGERKTREDNKGEVRSYKGKVMEGKGRNVKARNGKASMGR